MLFTSDIQPMLFTSDLELI